MKLSLIPVFAAFVIACGPPDPGDIHQFQQPQSFGQKCFSEFKMRCASIPEGGVDSICKNGINLDGAGLKHLCGGRIYHEYNPSRGEWEDGIYYFSCHERKRRDGTIIETPSVACHGKQPWKENFKKENFVPWR